LSLRLTKIFIRIYCVLFCCIGIFTHGITANTPVKSSPKESNKIAISPRFEHLTVSDGLSQGYVSAIYQDSKGFMWFGTLDGLNRYDGHNFRVFRNDPFDSTSLSGNYITAINEDRFGRLWIGTYYNGLNCLDPATETCRRFLHDPNNTNSLSNNQISAICEENTQNKNQSTTLWIGTDYGLNKLVLRENGVLVLREHEGPVLPVPLGSASEGEPGRNNTDLNSTTDYSITNYFNNSLDSSSLSHDVIYDLLIDRSNNLWIATRRGLNKLDLTAQNPNQPERFQRFMLKQNITTLFESSDNTLWVGSRGNLWKRDLEESKAGRYQKMLDFKELTNIESKNIFLNSMCQDQKGLLWLAMSFGLIIFDPKTNSFQLFQKQKDDPSGLSDNHQTCIFQDRSYLVWMGTVGFGLNKYDPYKEVFQTFTYKKIPKEPNRNIHPANYIQDLMVDGAVSMKEQTFLFDFDLRTGAYQLRRTFRHTDRVMMDHTKVGWVMSEKILIRYDTESQTFRDFIPDSMKNSLFLETQLEDGNKNIWAIGTFRKKIILCCWDRDTQSIFSNLIENPESIGQPNKHITDSFRDQNGIFWLTSFNGLYRIDLSTGSLRIFHNDPRNRRSLNQNYLKSMLPDPVFPERFFWIGTNGGGLNRFEKGAENFTFYTEKEGLPNNVVYGILADSKGNLWMSTNRGIANAILDPKTREIVSFKNYDEGDGLQGDEFNTWQYFQNERGDMFFAGIQGITVFHPDSVKSNPQAPPVVITGFQIHQQLVMPGSPGSPLEKVIAATEKITLPHSDNAITFESTVLDYANPGKNLSSYKLEGLNQDWSPPGNNRRANYTNLDPGDYVFRVRCSNSHGVWNEAGASLEITILPPWYRTWWAYVLYIFLSLGTIFGLLRYEIGRREAKHKYELEHVETEKLQELDRMKSRFFANISHEFRTPLTLILGPLEKFLSKTKDKKDKQDMTLAQRNAQRLLKLINELLDLSKLESGQMKLQASRLDIIQHLKNSLAFFESAANSKQIDLKFQTDKKSVIGYFDKDKMQNIFVNLISNAIKFTDEGGEVLVNVSTPPVPYHRHSLQSPLPRGGIKGGVEITVSDTGIGIPKSRLAQIFDRFYQVEESRSGEGTGIGLALTKELVQLHHGTIAVESEEGQGTTFTVQFPLGKTHLKPDEITETTAANDQLPNARMTNDPLTNDSMTNTPITGNEHPATSNQKPASSTKQQETILIIEDYPDMRAFIRENIETDYNVLEAENGEQGVNIALETIPDLIISDVMMPKMNGFQVCQKLKTDERTSHIPIILLTAKAEAENKIEGLETGADDYLLKPFYPKVLQIRIQNLIELRRKLRLRFSEITMVKPDELEITSVDKKFVQRLMDIIESHLADEFFGVEELCKEIGMSSPSLWRKIHGLFNKNPNQFIRSIRMQHAREMLEKNAGNITEIGFAVGFSNPAYFTKCFHKQFGKPPSFFKGRYDENGEK